MKIIQGMIQGDAAWLAHRRTTRNASDAPAMMGASAYRTRSDLLRQYATGMQPEIDDATQKRFDRGHEAEPLLRALIEESIGEELYPVIGTSDDGYLGASFDGTTMDEETIFEAKLKNAEKMASVCRGEIPLTDYWQVVQQFAVCDSARRCVYAVGDGLKDGTASLEVLRETIEHDIPNLIAGWKQFDIDVANYSPGPVKAVAVAVPVEGFGALSLRVEGRVLASNLDAFRTGAEAFIARLPKPNDLQTDQDFADADAAVKACAEAESRIKAAKDSAQAQMADVDSAFRLADSVIDMIRAARLGLDKVVKTEKEARKAAIVRYGVDAVREHYATINNTLKAHALGMPASLTAEIGASIKGLRTIKSITDAVDTAVANAKIEASQNADAVRANIAILGESFIGHEALFPDAVLLCATKQPEDLRNLVKLRISENEKREAARIEQERERIRAEELAKIERERARKEAADKARADQEAKAAQPAPVEPVAPVAAPKAATKQPANFRPTDDAIIRVLTTTYSVDSATVVGWLRSMQILESTAA